MWGAGSGAEKRHGLGRSGLDHLSGRGPHRPGLLGLQGQLVGHLERLAQRQDDLIGQVLGGGRAQGIWESGARPEQVLRALGVNDVMIRVPFLGKGPPPQLLL